MGAPFPSRPVVRLPANPGGRDFVVGDIHGAFDLVLRAMDRVRFDPSRDRILSLGDLIDRGPGSHRTARFLSHGWVHAVRGNHEDMLLEAYAEGDAHPAVLAYLAGRNGFAWWLDVPEELRRDIVEAVRRLPLAIEVPTERGLVGLVHADVPAGMSWQDFTARLAAGDEAVAHEALWSRRRVGRGDETGVPGIGRVYVGHTPLPRLAKLGNVYAVDTRAVHGLLSGADGALTFVEASSMTGAIVGLGADGPPADFVNALAEARTTREPFSGP
jgi:serine/threonine protein phosphatase 1